MARVPRHIAIVLDGNRRFAKRLMIKPWMGHEWGSKKVEQVYVWCQELGIKEITLYAMSIQNFNRPKEEFDYLMDLIKESFENLKKDPRANKIRINFIGRISMFPKDIQKIMKDLMEKTKNNTDHIINFAMAYGGREEVIDAITKMAKEVEKGTLDVAKINEKSFSSYLYTESEPELIIRTGGEKRTSNFLIWQSHYSEWIFVEKMWPEFTKEDFVECINEYTERQRRFGN